MIMPRWPGGVPVPDGYIARSLVNVRVGEEIRRLREKRGLTLRGLAKKLDISPPYLSDVEHGRRAIRKRLADVAQLLGVKVEHFVEICGVCPTCGGTGIDERRTNTARGKDEGNAK